MHDGGVEQKAADVGLHGLGLTCRHAEEHLELDPMLDAAAPGEQLRERDVEEVVAGDTDANGVRALGSERPVEQPLVVGVRLGLGVPRRERPAVQCRIDPLHGEIRALDQAHLDTGTARGATPERPLGEALQRRERVGQVGLQHDPGLEVPQPRLVEEALEHRDGEVEVAVLLHVEVDELGRAGESAANS